MQFKSFIKIKESSFKKKEDDSTNDILELINKNDPLNLQFNNDKYSKGDNKFVDQVKWVRGTYVVETNEDAKLF